MVAAAGGAVWVLPPGKDAEAAVLPGEPETAEVTVTQGTNVSAAPSPDGSQVVFDLYTSLWVVPAGGGRARRLTGDLVDATRPRFAPDGDRVVFQAYAEGNYHVYVLDLPDGKPRRLTEGPHDHREPAFSPDGTAIALASDRGGNYGIWVHDLASGKPSPVTDTDGDDAEPYWTPDGERIVHVRDGTSIRSAGLDGASEEIVAAADDTELHSPAAGPDGRVAHIAIHADTARVLVDGEAVSGADEDVFVGALTWTGDDTLFYTADGALRRRPVGGGDHRDTAFSATVGYLPHERRRARRDIGDRSKRPVRGIAGPVLSPDAERVAFRALGALWVMRIGGEPEAVADDGYFNSDPDWHPDGRSLVYSSDRTGTPALWRHDLETGARERLAESDGAQITPRWAPDGERVAYQDHDGATWVLDTASGTSRQVLPPLFQPGRPTWSADGRVLALAAVNPRSARFREGTSQILTVDLDGGATAYTEPAPYRSLSTRGDDGPVWSPDGSRVAFVMESVLWVAPVDAAGAFTGDPVRLTSEPTDAPSWSGDSSTLLYLCNGELRRIPADGGKPRKVPMPLTWRRPARTGRVVVQAGALWDGAAAELRRDVDIVIDGNRVTAVEDRRERAADDGTEIVDATGLTVMPGLIDAHNHWHLRGRHWGARQGPLWLSYGVTTTRSPGDPVYQMLETREALDSGAMIGPRYLATGEAIDGSRVYYNFMRTTTDDGDLEREMERAFELDYDMVKTYVRLPVRAQRTLVDRAHSADLPLSSHYLYPAVHLGMDGMEHTGATNRLGYSHTSSPMGRAYEDVTALFAASGMSITPTLFTSFLVHADDRSLVEDERTRVLFPAWEREALAAKADEAASDTARARQARRSLPNKVAMLKEIHDDGGLVIGGTDAPLDDIAVSLHTNLRAMVAHGFSPHAALTVTTSTAAEWLGLGDELGTVGPGRLADLVAVEGDPLTDIAAAAAVRLTIADGVVHTVDELMKPFAEPVAARAAQRAAEGAPYPSAKAGGHWWHGESERGSPHRC